MVSWSNGQHLTLVLVLLTLSYTIGIFIFAQGFLLNRLVVPKYSSCYDSLHNLSSLYPHKERSDNCWMKARFKKAVIIVIDALRYDFMVYNETLGVEKTKNYQNKLRVIHEIMRDKPENGRLFQFIADPPTTTMQRLKGLTTGSLPTFIDAGSNFASSEITEDNIISQIKNLGKNLIFMGDDTWMGLFPNSFKRSYPFPSFNVKDLHTVDNGVISHLIPELRTNDWDIIIAHFLGVDHCGHRYGPYHREMTDKLLQMDTVLRSVMDEVDNETLLVVYGDHGMTKTGDHGGDSLDEVQAGLFVYSSTKSFGYPKPNGDNLVYQTDIVPTLSLLLGSPIPFANLGNVIPSLFHDPHDEKQLLQALQLNAKQIYRYLTEYSKLSSDIPLKDLEKLTEIFLETEQHVLENVILSGKNGNISENVSSAVRNYIMYLKEVRELCRSVWARFDLTAIAIGIFIILLSCLASILVLVFPILPQHLHFNSLITGHRIFGSLALLTLIGFALTYGYISTYSAGVSAALSLAVTFHNILLLILRYIYNSWSPTIFTMFLVLSLYLFVFFSNSFVVYENKVALFLLQTVLLSYIVDVLRNSEFLSKFQENEPQRTTSKTRRRNTKKHNVATKTYLNLFFLVVLLLLTRLGKLFWSCREEQIDCETPFLVKPTNADSETNQQLEYYFWISPLLLCVTPASLLFRLRSTGNLNGNTCLILMVKYALPLGTCFGCIHWLLQFLPAKMLHDSPGIGFLQQILAPCFLYLACVLTLVCLLYKPLTVYFAGTYDTRGEPADSREDRTAGSTVVDIFRRLCSEIDKKDDERLPIVYGLGTVYSSTLLICLVCVSLPIALVLGDGQAPSVTLMLAHLCGCLAFYKRLVSNESDGEQSSGFVVFPIIIWFLLSSHYFFTTGHQATIPGIRFEAAFVGLPGDMANIYLPGFLIMLNTFGSDVIPVISLPLIIFWSNQFPGHKKSADLDECNKEELVYAEEPVRLSSETFRACAFYQFCKGIKLFGTVLAAAVHRRHLMVWKIFAPRFIFEGVSFIISSVMLVLVYCFILRLNNVLQSWLSTLEDKEQNIKLQR